MPAQLLAEALLARAEQAPDAVAYETVDFAGTVTPLSYAQLAGRASTLAERLAETPEGPVLIACPAGADYVTAVFGAFLAGRPIVPAFPPGPSARPDRDRLAGIVTDARPPVVVAQREHPEIAVPVLVRPPGADADAARWTAPRDRATDVAVVQYTSGSTGTPRGVLVRHDSLAANTAAITERFGLTPGSRALTWLPPFHDMGLVGGLLTPVAAGIPMRILQPADFLKAPLRWLRQIGEFGATHSGGPNFAYDLCVLRARDDAALDGLDLSTWRVAFSGGESVRRRTMTEFARRFGPAGFRAQAFLPCYGLAEATLMVTAGHWSGPADRADPDAPVSCGTPVPGQRVAIVDPDRGTPVENGGEGEIWIAGPHVTNGHLGGSSADLFGDLDGVPHLRTGDLGRLRDGELFVSGRLKDVLVLRGVNHHAVDIEAAALAALDRSGRAAAAFLVEPGTEPLAVLVVETHGRRAPELAARARAEVLARTGLRLDVVAVVGPRVLPRTSSGKIRRAAAREAFLAGAYGDAATADTDVSGAPVAPGDRAVVMTELSTLICGVAAAVCEADGCDPTDRLADLGMDSVRAAETAAVLEHALDLPVPLETVLAGATPAAAARELLAAWGAAGHDATRVRHRLDAAATAGAA